MNRLTLAALATAGIAALTGCPGGNYTISKTFSIDGTGNVVSTLPVDLKTDAPDAWDLRDKIKKVKVNGVSGTIVAVRAGNTTQAVSGDVLVSRAGSTPAVAAQGTNVPVALGTYQTAHDLDGTVGVIEAALDDDGTFTIQTEATPTPANGVTHIDVRVDIDLHIDGKLF